MGFRKTLVKLMNLVYIAGAGVAIYGICAQPIVSVNVGVSLTSKQVGKYVATAFGVENKDSKSYTVRLASRANETEDTFKDWLTEEKIAKAFPNGIKINQPIQVPVAKAFEFKNQNIIKETVVENLDSFVTVAVDKIAPGVFELFKEAAEDKAKQVLEDEINKTIADYFGDDAENQVTKDEVQEIFDNVYALVENNTASADDIANAILGNGEDEAGLHKILADRAAANGGMQVARVSEAEYNVEAAKSDEECLLFIKDGENYTPVSNSGSPLPYNEETTYYEAFDSSGISSEHISDALIDELSKFDGMVTSNGFIPCNPQPTEEQYNADLEKEEKDRKYYVATGDTSNPYVLASGAYDSSITYYKEDIQINDVDTALAHLLDVLLNGESKKASYRVSRGEPEKSEDEVRKILKEYIEKYIPVSAIDSFSAKVGNKAAYILLGVIAFFILPWAWFALLTLVRTLRRHKIWTRTWMVFVFGLPQLILGIVVRYGSKGILDALGNNIPVLKTIAGIFTPEIRFSCLWASFVYLAMIPFVIVYLIVAHPFKTRWRFEKELKRHDREQAQMEARRR